MTVLVSALQRASRGEVLQDVPLAPRTSVRVGGPAQLWVRPRDPEALVAVLGVLCDAGVPWFTLGGGANTVVGDVGVEGAVLKLGPDFAAVHHHGPLPRVRPAQAVGRHVQRVAGVTRVALPDLDHGKARRGSRSPRPTGCAGSAHPSCAFPIGTASCPRAPC